MEHMTLMQAKDLSDRLNFFGFNKQIVSTFRWLHRYRFALIMIAAKINSQHLVKHLHKNRFGFEFCLERFIAFKSVERRS